MLPTRNVLLLAACLISCVHAMSEEEYSDFLKMVESQSKLDEDRSSRFVYRGTPDPEDMHRYSKDRHGQYYLKCVEHNSTVSEKNTNVRCPMRSGNERPGCFTTHDYTNGVTIQGCYDAPRFDRDTCNDECVIQVKKHTVQHGLKSAVVGFCCCMTTSCNDRAKIALDTAYDDYLAKRPHHHHHHHHHQNNVQDTLSFWERVRNF